MSSCDSKSPMTGQWHSSWVQHVINHFFNRCHTSISIPKNWNFTVLTNTIETHIYLAWCQHMPTTHVFFWPPRTIRRRRSVTTSREWGSLLGPRELKVQGRLLGDFWKAGGVVRFGSLEIVSLYDVGIEILCTYACIYIYTVYVSIIVYLTDYRWLQYIYKHDNHRAYHWIGLLGNRYSWNHHFSIEQT